jgi:ribose transport system permease protein
MRVSEVPVGLATIALFLISPVLVTGSLSQSSLGAMLPFAAVLAVAAVGQTLVVQQGGLDFSVASIVTLSAVVFARTADQHSDRILVACVVTVVVAGAIGLTSAIAIVLFRITPLVATLGVNAIVLGIVQRTSGGISVVPGPHSLTTFALGSTLGVRNLIWVAVVVVGSVAAVGNLTALGRRFEAVGANPVAARTLGIRVGMMQTGAYITAAITYAFAGIMLVGLLVTPGLAIGDPYLLSTIAAVVVGGTALGGGSGSVIASAIGAVFLTQLTQLILAAGTQTSINYLVQGGVIGLSMLTRSFFQRAVANRQRLRTAPDPARGNPTAREPSPSDAVASRGPVSSDVDAALTGATSMARSDTGTDDERGVQ